MKPPTVIHFAEDFADTPGGRRIVDGPKSGQEFLEVHLEPRFVLALELGCRLVVDLFGIEGMAACFIDEAFGTLARRYSAATVRRVLDVQGPDFYVEEIADLIEEVAEKETRKR